MPKSYRDHGAKTKYWCGTWNHEGMREPLLPANAEMLASHQWFKGIWASEERGREGTLHIQFYVELHTRKTFNAMKEEFPQVHWEQRRGTAQQARDYCMGKTKEGGVKPGWIKVLIEKGEVEEKKPGKRTDIEKMRELLDGAEVRNVMDAMEHCTTMASLSFAKEWLACHAPPPRATPPKVFWFYGSTGTGKTRAVYDFVAESGLELWRMPSSGSFFQGYIGQPIALFDDFREGRLPFTELLELTDRYNPIANVKYGQCWFTPQWIIFTSAKSIEVTFANVHEDVGQFLRRVREGGGAELNFNEDGLGKFKERIDVYLQK